MRSARMCLEPGGTVVALCGLDGHSTKAVQIAGKPPGSVVLVSGLPRDLGVGGARAACS